MRSHFVSFGVKILDLTVIGPFVRNVECGTNWTTIWIDTPFSKEICIKLFIQVIHGVVERQDYNLRNGFHR